LGWPQSQLAGRLGISRATLANIETGRQRVLVHMLYRVALALGVTPGDLLPLPSDTAQSPVSQGLPLPKGLSAIHSDQLARLYEPPPAMRVRSKKDQNAKLKKGNA
jgi:transcriptional regulator with XRE-family HTH domain